MQIFSYWRHYKKCHQNGPFWPILVTFLIMSSIGELLYYWSYKHLILPCKGTTRSNNSVSCTSFSLFPPSTLSVQTMKLDHRSTLLATHLYVSTCCTVIKNNTYVSRSIGGLLNPFITWPRLVLFDNYSVIWWQTAHDCFTPFSLCFNSIPANMI